MLGAINTITKDFRIEGVLSSDAETLKKFITTYIPKGSNITTDGWVGYAFLNDLDSPITTVQVILDLASNRHPMLNRCGLY